MRRGLDLNMRLKVSPKGRSFLGILPFGGYKRRKVCLGILRLLGM
jgi:hypothetical protein